VSAIVTAIGDAGAPASRIGVSSTNDERTMNGSLQTEATVARSRQAYLHELLEDMELPAARLVNFGILVLILLSVGALAYSTVPGLSPHVSTMLEWFQTGAVIVFSLEYLLRLFAAGGRPGSKGSGREALAYATSFYGVIDLLAILPFYLDLGGFIALRSLRILRLLRLFKVARYTQALAMLAQVLRERSSQLGAFLFVSLLFVFVAATGIYYFEHEQQPEAFASIPASIWWAIVTLTTVGYGDSYPVTLGGKTFTALVVLIGLGVIAIPTGIISAGLVDSMDEAKNAQQQDSGEMCPTCGRPRDT
jgi:voltage-gated potassium channel